MRRHLRLLSLLGLSLLAMRGTGLGADGDEGTDWAVKGELSARKLVRNPADEKAWAELVDARIHQADFSRAEEALREWRAKVPAPAAASDKIEGELAAAEGDDRRAVEAWKRYLKREPADDDGWRQLASAYGDAKDWADGIDAMGHALAIRGDAEGFVQRANLRIRMHDWAGAESDVREANRLDATNANVQALYPIFERSAAWLPALTALDQKVRSQPGDFEIRLDRAEWLRWCGFPDAAQDDIEAAFAINPKSLRARFWRGLTAQERLAVDRTKTLDENSGQLEKDKACAGEVMPLGGEIDHEFEVELEAADGETDPEARAQFLLKYHQPLMALREVAEVDGSPAKAQALVALDRLPEAGQAARRATERHPDSAMAWMALARWELASGNNRETLEAVERAARLRKTPETEELRKTALMRLGKR